MLNALNIEALLTETTAFLQTMYAVQEDFSIVPAKKHIATCINYVDLEEMRDDFVEELVGTLVPFVYSTEKREEIIAKFRKGRTEDGARDKLRRHCLKKFRQYSSQGQFSELLLCNLLQHYFRAAPLVRKYPITTNPEVERNGADAIHIARENDKILLYLGEAKTYYPVGGLRTALREGVSDIVHKHYKNLRNELNLYVYESFVPPELEQAALDFQEGRLVNAEVHLVCIVAYDLAEPAKGNRQERLDGTIRSVRDALKGISDTPTLKGIDADLLPRLNYIFFPVRELKTLVELFRKQLGLS